MQHRKIISKWFLVSTKLAYQMLATSAELLCRHSFGERYRLSMLMGFCGYLCYAAWGTCRELYLPGGDGLNEPTAENIWRPSLRAEKAFGAVVPRPNEKPPVALNIRVSYMDPERETFLNLKTPPARLNSEQVAWYLGFAHHDVPILVGKGLLKPLGHFRNGTVKFFALVQLERCRHDAKWLARATDAIVEHWRLKNTHRMVE